VEAEKILGGDAASARFVADDHPFARVSAMGSPSPFAVSPPGLHRRLAPPASFC
jgi:hypothetical protein